MLELATVEKELELYGTSDSVELKKDELTKKERISTHQAGNNDMAELLLKTYQLVHEQKLEWYEEFVQSKYEYYESKCSCTTCSHSKLETDYTSSTACIKLSITSAGTTTDHNGFTYYK